MGGEDDVESIEYSTHKHWETDYTEDRYRRGIINKAGWNSNHSKG